MSENKNKYFKPIFWGLMILIGVIFFWVNYIEVSSNEYVVFNEKDERLNAIVIAKGDLIRVRFPDIENSTFITIVKKIKYIGVNTIGYEKNRGTLRKAKKIKFRRILLKSKVDQILDSINASNYTALFKVH
jgi:hypothetical protein